MVRILTGTLIEVGEGKRKASEMENILRAGKREEAGFTAPSRGLFLREVYYEDWKGGAEV
jgi:tRNA pseudouridine38-40 synthase